MQPLAVALRIENAFGKRARLATEDAIGLKDVPVAEMREHSRGVQKLDVFADAAAAAPTSGATGVRNEAELANVDRIDGRVELDGYVVAVHHRRHAFKTVLAVAPAVAG